MNMEDVRAIARGGRVFDLGVDLFPGMPHAPLHGPFGYSIAPPSYVMAENPRIRAVRSAFPGNPDCLSDQWSSYLIVSVLRIPRALIRRIPRDEAAVYSILDPEITWARRSRFRRGYRAITLADARAKQRGGSDQELLGGGGVDVHGGRELRIGEGIDRRGARLKRRGEIV